MFKIENIKNDNRISDRSISSLRLSGKVKGIVIGYNRRESEKKKSEFYLSIIMVINGKIIKKFMNIADIFLIADVNFRHLCQVMFS